MTQNIFLSYRRNDSRGYTNAIYTLLELHFPPDSIFMDVDTLVPGSDFVQSLEEAVENCDIFLAIIGSRWENIEDHKGLRRLDNPEDFVRIEVAHALKRGIPVIPVLVDGAQMPFTENLPDNLKDLARRHAFSIGDHLRSDVQRLIKVLEKTFERLEKEHLKREKKEAELLARAQADEERITQEQAEADRKAKEQAEADRIAKEKAEADRTAKEKSEADRVAKEKAEVDRIAKEKAEADRIAKEKAETDRIAKEKAEAEQKAKEEAEAEKRAAEEKERLVLQKAAEELKKQEKVEAEKKAKAQAEAEQKAKKERDKKARALAAAEKKEANRLKRISRQRAKSTAAAQTEKAISPSISVVKKVPFWVWPVAGVVLITIGYAIFGGFSPDSPEETRETGVSLAVAANTNTPTSVVISNTPTLKPTSTSTPEPTATSTAVPTQTPTPEPSAGAELSNLADGAVMVYVPSGEFIMGSDSGESNESPAHTVYLDGFWIGKTEVTNAMYRLCVEADACFEGWHADQFANAIWDNYPVVSIGWKQANNYCRWAGGYLPTEAQWEKAARGEDGRTYPWGEDIDYSLANYGGYIGFRTSVGRYSWVESPYGLWDMAGNVAEFVADWYDAGYYSISPEVNPLGPEDGLQRGVRGGSWRNSAENIRVTRRSSAFVDEWESELVGFRCASSETPQGEAPAGSE